MAEGKPPKKSFSDHADAILTAKYRWLVPLRDALNEFVPPARMGWYIFAFLALLGFHFYQRGEWKSENREFAIALDTLKWKFENLRDDSIQWKIKSGRVDSLDQRVHDLNLQLVRAENERDKAREKLAPFELQAARIYTNELPTEALNRLFQDIQADDFAVFVNGVLLTNSATAANVQTVDVSSKQLEIVVKNMGRYPLQHVTIYCFGRWMDETNVVANGWTRPGHITISDEFGSKVLSSWRVIGDAAYGKSLSFRAPPIIIETNVIAALRASSNVFLQTFIQVHSDRSDLHEFRFGLNCAKK